MPTAPAVPRGVRILDADRAGVGAGVDIEALQRVVLRQRDALAGAAVSWIDRRDVGAKSVSVTTRARRARAV